MGFTVISKHHGDTLYAGQIIEYKVRLVLNIPIYWMTEITQVKVREYFIDEQRYGPCSSWPIHYLYKKKLKAIFNYQFKKVEEMFAKWNDKH